MAPVRKSRSVNKRFPYPNEASPVKDGDSAGKSSKRKRKVSDMLGPQWSKDDLQRFYEAYRKHGKDWKKVAAAVRNRSVEMVEALYTMNRAYLSLPEGTASVVGLIAMMTDHYSVLEGSDSEQESNDGVGLPRKSHKRPRGKLPTTPKASDKHSSDVSRPQSIASTYGCLSLLKKRRLDGNQPRAVGKRTPRIPVRYTYDNMERSRQVLKSKLEAVDDDVAHEVALALAEASHRGGSPQASQTPNRRRETAATSPAGFGDQMCSESEMTSAKNIGNEINDDVCEGSLGSTEGDYNFPGGKHHFPGKKGVGLVRQKAKKSCGKKLEVQDVGQHDVDDIKEACSGTEEGQRFSDFGRKLGTEFQDNAFVRTPGQASKKRSKKVLFGEDEGVALDALQALADLSLLRPGSATEAESTTPLKEEKERSTSQLSAQESGPAKGKAKASPSKKKVDNSAFNTKVSEYKMLKSGKLSVPESSLAGEIKDSCTRRRKQKSFVPKDASEVKTDADPCALKKLEVRDNGIKVVTKSGRASHIVSEQQHGDLVKNTEHSSSSVDIRREGDDSVMSSIQASPTINTNSPTKSRSRRKLNKPQIQRSSRDLKKMDAFVYELSKSSGWSIHDKVVDLKEKLSNCLCNDRVRRWCIYEWFYSAIDYPWFAKSEFVEYLYHVGLGHVPRLTRVEWGVIRSSLGRPRRFSEQFLKEEKKKLNSYRESVRNHYSELHMGNGDGLPADLARPLTVGQHVIAIHPQSREVSNGSILTVDHKRCRVQFDQPELGVEFVKDIDCMPLNPLENMPTYLKRQKLGVDKFYEALKQFKVVGERLEDRVKEESIKFAPGQKVENPDIASYAAHAFLSENLSMLAKEPFVGPNKHEKAGHNEVVSSPLAMVSQQSALSQMQAREADICALAELTRVLDKKNALVMELKRMNDDVSEDRSLKDVDCFKKQYAAVLVQLNEVLDQVSSALLCLRQRNTYQGNFPLLWQKPMSTLEDRDNIASYFSSVPVDSQEAGSHVCEIVETSRTKAQKMVDAVLQVVSSIKEGANACHRVDDVVDDGSRRLSVDKSTTALQATQPNGNLASHNQLTSCASNLMDSDRASDYISKVASAEGESEVPSELITNCVATLLMIQKCTERQFPPAEVAQILDFAVTNLQPRCSQNLPVYAEIQKCMGIIRSQILALIPT